VSISIDGHSGAWGYQPHGSVALEYFSPVDGRTVRDTVVIGGGYQPTVVTVTTGSLFAGKSWMGSITVTPIDNGGHAVGPVVSLWERFIGVTSTNPVTGVTGVGSKSSVAGAVNGIFGVPSYHVSVLPSSPSAIAPLNGGIHLNKTYPPSYLEKLGIDPNKLGPLYDAQYDARGNFIGIDPRCFPADTPIAVSLTESCPISDLRVGDTVLAFDPVADLGRGALVPRKVVRLYRNTTEEWVKLTWSEGGEARELVATPGHHFLDRFGGFPTIEEMLENGRATVVLVSGELTEVTAERIAYSAETAHLFEQAFAVGAVAGNAALRPALLDAWQTYNFEIEGLHTYVAGGVRVHNHSGPLGKMGNLSSNLANVSSVAKLHMSTASTGAAPAPSVKQYSADPGGYGLGPGARDGGNSMNGGSTMPSTAPKPASSTGASAKPSAKTVAADPGGWGLGPGSRDGGNSMGSGSSPSKPSSGSTVKSGSSSGLSNTNAGRPDRDQQGGGAAKPTPNPSGKSGAPTGGTKSPGRADRDQQGSPTKSSPSPSSPSKPNSNGNNGPSARDKSDSKRRPVLLDLDGNGVRVSEFGDSTIYANIGNDGFKRRTAWAGAGDGVLFVDADGNGRLSGRREVVFTDWDPSADTDMQALRQVFDLHQYTYLSAVGWH
jgi:hypothetical protein